MEETGARQTNLSYHLRVLREAGVVETEPATDQHTAETGVVGKLSTLDRFLAVWILAAMALGLGLGRLIPGLNDALSKVEIGGISLPIASAC